MAHYVPAEEFKELTGALSKRKDTRRYCVTRIKHVKDPLTGEVVGTGPKEIYAQNRRDYRSAPLTPGEQVQRSRWRDACREATANAPCKQFGNFVRAVLVSEKRSV